MADRDDKASEGRDMLEEMAHWTGIVGQMQQKLMEHGLSAALKMSDDAAAAFTALPMDPTSFAAAQTMWWNEAASLWRSMLPFDVQDAAAAARDPAFRGERWQEPIFDVIRQSYVAIADQLLAGVDAISGLDPRMKEQLRFATKSFVEAMSPANFAATNPQVLERILATRGANLITG